MQLMESQSLYCCQRFKYGTHRLVLVLIDHYARIIWPKIKYEINGLRTRAKEINEKLNLHRRSPPNTPDPPKVKSLSMVHEFDWEHRPSCIFVFYENSRESSGENAFDHTPKHRANLWFFIFLCMLFNREQLQTSRGFWTLTIGEEICWISLDRMW